MRTSLGNLPITVDPVTGRARVVRGGVEDARERGGCKASAVGTARPATSRKAEGGNAPPAGLSPVLAPTFDSQLEADRAQYLFGLQLGEMIVRYVHHPFSVDIGSGREYTPDFLVEWIGGHITVEEIKGSLKQKNARDSETRFLVAAAKLPMFQWQLITRVKRQWIVRRSL